MTKTLQGLAKVTLDDKYAARGGRVYLTGIQALVRLLLLQSERDRQAGLNTGGFVSGYRGSPLGTLDNALWQAEGRLSASNILFKPGLNEELAATALWGTQQVTLGGRACVDGVFGMWYGKGPGVDRSLDVLKHANLDGTSTHGGVLAIAGDDHGCQSSTLAHQSEQTLIAAMIPILNPASVQEYLDFGIVGYGLSRYSGCWVGFKAVGETVESSASIELRADRIVLREPSDFVLPAEGLHIRWPDSFLAQEARLHGPKMEAIAAYARANRVDQMIFEPRSARLGIITTGKAYLDVRQALANLGIDQDRAESLGIRLYKVGLSWPLEPVGARSFATDLQHILVIEEKRSLIEDQITRLLFNLSAKCRATVVGKRDETGAPMLRSEGELSVADVARAIVSRLHLLGPVDADLIERLARLESLEAFRSVPGTLARTPFFCSGCPHNTSTRVPEGSRAIAGIGCHGMALLIPSRHTERPTHMGGEGANWIGQAPFSKDKHVFQNLGDGTYAHSGLMAIRAAVAAGVNITCKILYNDAVAMTGGQPAEGHFTVPQISRQVAAEGVSKVVVVTDETKRYANVRDLAPGTMVHDRDQLDRIQRELREISGVTVLIYDQTCAAEKRRRRKRGLIEDSARRVFINEAVCEGCGDCSDASNCISIVPLETEFGRRRTIDQSSCNKDYSCIKGFCPSFVIVEGGTLRRSQPRPGRGTSLLEGVPEPTPVPLDQPYNILVAGVGGTGVVTIGAILGMAAHLEGKAVTVSDFTGLSQKGGAVTSHVRFAASPGELNAVRIGPGSAHLLLGYDPIVAISKEGLSRIEAGVTRVVMNTHVAPTGSFVADPDIDFQEVRVRKEFMNRIGEACLHYVEATNLATRVLGDAIGTNLLLLGYAYQKGLLPLSGEAIINAIDLNGTAVAMNKEAFAWGRLAAQSPEGLAALVDDGSAGDVPFDLEEVVRRRYADLVLYQNKSYAERYLRLVNFVREAEERIDPKSQRLTWSVVASFHKLMAYKDEFEVARLYTDGRFRRRLESQFDGKFRLRFSMAPPMFARRDPSTGRLAKHLYGGWMFHALKILAKLRWLRGTPINPFGYLADRRIERALIGDYESRLQDIASVLDAANLEIAVQIADLPQKIRGFGHVKDRNIEAAKARATELLRVFHKTDAKVEAA